MTIIIDTPEKLSQLTKAISATTFKEDSLPETEHFKIFRSVCYGMNPDVAKYHVREKDGVTGFIQDSCYAKGDSILPLVVRMNEAEDWYQKNQRLVYDSKRN